MRTQRLLHRSGRKPIAVVIALLICAATMLGSAFAWKDFSQSYINKFRGTFDADVTLHDEFDGCTKHVFVENSGTTKPIYVRVRLDEVMIVGETVFKINTLHEPDIKNPATWYPHTYNDSSLPITDCGHADYDQYHTGTFLHCATLHKLA